MYHISNEREQISRQIYDLLFMLRDYTLRLFFHTVYYTATINFLWTWRNIFFALPHAKSTTDGLTWNYPNPLHTFGRSRKVFQVARRIRELCNIEWWQATWRIRLNWNQLPRSGRLGPKILQTPDAQRPALANQHTCNISNIMLHVQAYWLANSGR